MHKIKYFLFFLFIFCVSLQNAMSLEREYFAEEYCCTHQPPSATFNRIQQNMPFIPGSRQCLHMLCSKCNNVWTEHYIHEGEYGDEDWIEIYWNCKCKEKFLSKNFKRYWDCLMSTWTQCENRGIYDGYFSQDHRRYTSFFDEYLQYINKNQNCNCFWPEISKKAATINDTAYNLFKNLFESTDLSQLIENVKLQRDFFLTSPIEGFNTHGATISFVCHSFFYSDYDWICRDIEFYSRLHFDENSIAQIKNNLDEIKETLAELFLNVYSECLQKHPHKKIQQELCLVKSYLNLPLFEEYPEANTSLSHSLFSKNFIDPLEDNNILIENKFQTLRRMKKKSFSLVNPKKQFFFDKNENHEKLISMEQICRPSNWEQSDVFLSQGTFLNDLNLYPEAIELLTHSIQLNPVNRFAYIERAMAYFETNELPLALEDYERAKKLNFSPPFKPEFCNAISIAGIYVPENKIEFSNGLIQGLMGGAKVSSIEFFPSLLSSLRGILNGLWSFTCSPVEVSKEMLYTSYAIGEFIGDNGTEECLHCLVPELKELSISWRQLNEYSRGHKIGFIIGKYGIDIFAPFGVLKGASKFRALKRANTVCTLESCAVSQAKQAKILEESVNRALFREKLIIEATKKSAILTNSSNVQYHIMQKKHAWDKIANLSGIIEEDFQKVILLLEKHNITDPKNLIGKSTLFPINSPKIKKSIFEIDINGYKVHAEFETYLSTQLTFIKDAWVVQ